MRYWELAGEVEYRKLVWSAVILAGLAANGMVVGLGFELDRRPVLAVRTTATGESDLVELPDAVAARPHMAERFVEQLSSRMFGWDEVRKAANREYVQERVRGEVFERMRQLVPAYEASLRDDVAGRVDAEVQITRVIGEEAPYQVEIRTDIEFSGDYAPPGLGERDPENARRESYAFLFTVAEERRTPTNPAGLVVTELARVSLGEGASS